MIKVPQGFRVAGLHCGLKRNPSREDISLVVSDAPCVAAGVYTTNQVVAAPVVLDRQRTPSDAMRVVVVNSGNANACTGATGQEHAIQMTRVAADACGALPEQVLVMSTGIIGEVLPMEKVSAGIRAAAAQLSRDQAALLATARGLMTTDTRHKLVGRQVSIGPSHAQLTGMAKGAGMIGPRMATLLGLILTDACLTANSAQHVLAEVVEQSFNCVSVEGHMSTNDTVLLLASGQVGQEALRGKSLHEFQTALEQLCIELAKSVASDGEGATHLIEIHVTGCTDHGSARQIARTIAESPLVKTAVAGADPNWGRIVSAAGYAGPPLDISQTRLEVNGFVLFDRGGPVPFDRQDVSQSIKANRDTSLCLQVGSGPGHACFWTCDLTTEYVHINADYHT